MKSRRKVYGEKGKKFAYRDIKQVYTIVFFERSSAEFKDFPEHFCHKFRQRSDTGLELELLQEYFFLPLDIFRKSMENKEKREIGNELEAWLTFLSFDEPEWIIQLITEYPQFKGMYQQMYEICLNMEKVMTVYSKELAELDRNTVYYMIDEMQAQLEESKRREEESKRREEESKRREEESRKREEEKDRRIEAMNRQILQLEELLRAKEGNESNQ